MCMEESFAGKSTLSNSAYESPKKVYNPIATETQWSLGWQSDSKPTSIQTPKSKQSSSLFT